MTALTSFLAIETSSAIFWISSDFDIMSFVPLVKEALGRLGDFRAPPYSVTLGRFAAGCPQKSRQKLLKAAHNRRKSRAAKLRSAMRFKAGSYSANVLSTSVMLLILNLNSMLLELVTAQSI